MKWKKAKHGMETGQNGNEWKWTRKIMGWTGPNGYELEWTGQEQHMKWTGQNFNRSEQTRTEHGMDGTKRQLIGIWNGQGHQWNGRDKEKIIGIWNGQGHTWNGQVKMDKTGSMGLSNGWSAKQSVPRDAIGARSRLRGGEQKHEINIK